MRQRISPRFQYRISLNTLIKRNRQKQLGTWWNAVYSEKMYSVPSSLGAPSLLSLHLLHLSHLIGKTDYPGPPHANNQGQHLIETGPISMSSG